MPVIFLPSARINRYLCETKLEWKKRQLALVYIQDKTHQRCKKLLSNYILYHQMTIRQYSLFFILTYSVSLCYDQSNISESFKLYSMIMIACQLKIYVFHFFYKISPLVKKTESLEFPSKHSSHNLWNCSLDEYHFILRISLIL